MCFFRPILILPPTDIQMIECEQSESERDFYNALFERSKVSCVIVLSVNNKQIVPLLSVCIKSVNWEMVIVHRAFTRNLFSLNTGFLNAIICAFQTGSI